MTDAIKLRAMLKTYPFLKERATTSIFLTEEGDLTKFFTRGKKNAMFLPSDKLSEEFLTNDYYYGMLARFFKSKIPSLTVTHVANGYITFSIPIEKIPTIEKLSSLIESGSIKPTEKILSRFNTLKNLVSYQTFKSAQSDKTFSTKIGNRTINMPASSILKLLELDPSEFLNIFGYNGEEKPNKTLQILLYVCQEYISSVGLNNVDFSNNILQNYKSIDEYKTINIEALNILNETEDKLYSQVALDPEFVNCIMAKVPKEFNKLEQAIYIYITLCKGFTYDDAYFTNSGYDDAYKSHKSIEDLQRLNTNKNNKLVCYEFNMIYSIFLNKLGINFISLDRCGSPIKDEDYANVHASIKFKVGDYLVFADSVTSILGGDLINAKLDEPLIGIVCKNNDLKMKKQFNEHVKKVYNYIIEHDSTKKQLTPNFEDALQEFKNFEDGKPIPSFEDRLKLFLTCLKNCKLAPVDAIGYGIKLKHTLFSLEELAYKFDYLMVENINNTLTNNKPTISAIITTNNSNIDKEPEKNTYYFYNANGKIKQIKPISIKLLIKLGLLKYHSLGDHIPGIDKLKIDDAKNLYQADNFDDKIWGQEIV